MSWKYALITLLYVCTVKSGYGDDDCIYKYICENEPTKYQREIRGKPAQCNLKNIPNNELMFTNEGNSSMLTTILNLPNAQCTYDIALVANATVKSQEECEKHEFNDNFNSYQEVYTDYRICVVNEQSQPEHQNNSICKNDRIVLTHEHIFSGCYALRFSTDDDEYKYIYQGRKYISTNYELTKVQEPTHQCTYFNREGVNDSSDAVMFSLDISLYSTSPALHLGLRTFPSDYESENNACTKYGRDYTGDGWAINMNNSAPRSLFTRNCSFMTVHENLSPDPSYAESIDCRFSLNLPSNMSYCFKLKVIDERCSKNTLWNMPRRSYPCRWMLECTRDPKIRESLEHIGEVDGPRKIIAESSLFLPVGVALILFVLVLSGILITIHRWRANTQQAYLTANMRDLRRSSNNEPDTIDTDDELRRLEKNVDSDEKGIVLLYARGSTSFMALMTEFREILKLCCKCHVYDWYSACEWNNVAKVGACDWAINLFKSHHRAVWIDIPRTRALASNQPGDKFCGDGLSDFRDLAFAAVLHYAKRTVLNTKLQYSRHFIVRLEGLDHGSSTEDPFSDLSPHARYLIPYHLSQLCSHLSLRKSDDRVQAVMTEEAQLRERLIQLKTVYQFAHPTFILLRKSPWVKFGVLSFFLLTVVDAICLRLVDGVLATLQSFFPGDVPSDFNFPRSTITILHHSSSSYI